VNGGTVFYTEIATENTDYKFGSANYSIFIPEGIDALRGILIHQHGCGNFDKSKSSNIVYDLQYQEFARKWNLALLGPALSQFKNCPDCGNPSNGIRECLEWSDPANGSEKALLVSLNTFADSSGHPELKAVPWLLWGHSGGGHWVLSMLNKHPEKVIALFAVSPAFDERFDFPPAAANVPVMLRHAGAKDFNDKGVNCWGNSVTQYLKLRAMKGNASIAYSPKNEHGSGDSRYLAIPFFDAVLAQRLPPKGSSVIRDMDISKAWFGDTVTHQIFKNSAVAGKNENYCWLPDSLMAVKWRELALTGTVRDFTPPLPPSNLKVTSTVEAKYAVSWMAKADIESGISHFNIYKNDSLLGRVPESGEYQGFGYGDEPKGPALAELTFRFDKLSENIKVTIAVTIVNRTGLESAKQQIIIR
jgi:pimeloyl-ACP methyl ester carboxylesterase